jgi:integrase/recombinase XerD
MKTQATFSELLQSFFTERLVNQCNASPHAIANYRDTFRLLLSFAQGALKRPPTALPLSASTGPVLERRAL